MGLFNRKGQGNGVVGNGGTSNQTNASFQIGRAKRHSSSLLTDRLSEVNSRRSQGAPRNREQDRQNRFDATRAEYVHSQTMKGLQGWEDTPFGPALTHEAASGRVAQRTGRRTSNVGKTLLDRPSDGGDEYIRRRFNDSSYTSRSN